jgi:hypothetical protein
MFKYGLLAAAAAVLAGPALAQAVAPDIELEGTIENYVGSTRMLTVMGTEVYVPPTATIHSPTTTQPASGISVTQWFRGATFQGRTRIGMLGGTAIVVGEWDAAAGRIVAHDVFTEPSENVSLGVITDNFCSNSRCNGAFDFIRTNSKPGGGPGPAMLPITDPRMAADRIRDETGFDLNMTGVNMRGLGYAAEGFYGNAPVPVRNGTSGGAVSENAFHYFLFDLVEPSPQFFLNKTVRELSVLRTDCREGNDNFEIRGFIHSRVSPDGTVNDTIRPNNGVVEVFYNRANGQLVRANATATVLAANSPIGIYRIRFDQPGGECPATIGVRWVQTANQANPNVYAQVTGVATEIRLP